MKNVKILDCTLRDGGRIINCEFPNADIKDISFRLAASNIDIIEVGFLRGASKVDYKGDSTFFTDVDQIRPFVDRTKNTKYVAFIDFELFDWDSLKPFDGTSIDGIRIGWTKKSFSTQKDEIIKRLREIKGKGYMLFIQGVNILGYSDRELLDILDFVNEIHPSGFGIVDTYGAMYIDDLDRIYTMVDHNLDEDICIDFHSHNNYQLSQIVIDGTLHGMGKVAGNLNTELIVDYLVRKRNYDYNFDSILDLIDDYIKPIQLQHKWGYSVPALMAGIYKSHPNNVIYLTEKFRLATKDIKYIISMIEPQLRMRYDYDNIQRVYQEYNNTKVDDSKALQTIKTQLEGRNLVLVMPGSSIVEYREKIFSHIKEHKAKVILVNFIDEDYLQFDCLAFWGSNKRYAKFKELRPRVTSIVTSNVEVDKDSDLVVNYDSYINRTEEYSDNTSLMLMKVLQRIGCINYAIAGFDGFKENGSYYNENNYKEVRFKSKYDEINKALSKHLANFADSLSNKKGIFFITPSIYKNIFEE